MLNNEPQYSYHHTSVPPVEITELERILLNPTLSRKHNKSYLSSLPQSIDDLTEETENFSNMQPKQLTKTFINSKNSSPQRVSFIKQASSGFPFKSPFLS